MGGLVCYSIKETIAGRRLDRFDDLVDLDGWTGPPPRQYETDAGSMVEAKLYTVEPPAREPDWATFLRAGFGATVRFKKMSAPGAVLIVRFGWRNTQRLMAFTFGSGRFLLRSNVYERRFGIRTALNIIFEGDDGNDDLDAARLRSIDAKRVGANTVRMRHQSTRKADFEELDLDRDRDFMGGVTGTPQDHDWGNNITGADSLTTTATVEFSDLPEYCRKLLDAHNQTAYQRRYSWIDDIGVVHDEPTIQRLENHVIETLRNEKQTPLELGVPTIIDWDRISWFHLPLERRPEVRRPELRLRDYLSVLRRHDKTARITIDYLRHQRIDALDGDGRRQYSWPVWHCLSGELDIDDQTYVLDEGTFYEVNRDYLTRLNQAIDNIPETQLLLPPSTVKKIEATYNYEAAQERSLLLLDKELVSIERRTGEIEICDLLSQNHQFIHVKRKLGSSGLSHLFAQGMVSADLYQTSAQFRENAYKKATEVAAANGGPDWALLAENLQFLEEQPNWDAVEVVYGIIANWKKQQLSECLPFFSKINLRKYANDLVSRGFRISHCKIQTRLT